MSANAVDVAMHRAIERLRQALDGSNESRPSRLTGHASGHGPSVSPCARCAGTAFSLTLIVMGCSGFPGGMWQISTFSLY